MLRLIRNLSQLGRSEDGHTAPLLMAIVGAGGAIALGIGASEDSSIVAIVGGVVLGLGVIGAIVANHMTIDYEIYNRLNDLEK
ncbi:MAG: hypothetical protein DRI30_02210 [Chloroflexi bacterium]|nr:MAG: hypothetical protein DRI30_02210 [Chloroflexota bacterium]